MGADVKKCSACGGTHFNLFVYRGHQGRDNYVFCPATRKAVTVAVAFKPQRQSDADTYREWCEMSDRERFGVED